MRSLQFTSYTHLSVTSILFDSMFKLLYT